MAFLYNPLGHLVKARNLRVCSPALLTSRTVISSRFIKFTTTLHSYTTTSKPRTMAPSAVQGGIPWDLLVEFAMEKKAEEERTGLPAQLGQQQITAISSLISLIPEPDVTGNWISTLTGESISSSSLLPHID